MHTYVLMKPETTAWVIHSEDEPTFPQRALKEEFDRDLEEANRSSAAIPHGKYHWQPIRFSCDDMAPWDERTELVLSQDERAWRLYGCRVTMVEARLPKPSMKWLLYYDRAVLLA